MKYNRLTIINNRYSIDKYRNIICQCMCDCGKYTINRRTNIYITAWNETKRQKEWSQDSRCSVSESTISNRIKQGMTPEQAINTPNMRKQ